VVELSVGGHKTESGPDEGPLRSDVVQSRVGDHPEETMAGGHRQILRNRHRRIRGPGPTGRPVEEWVVSIMHFEADKVVGERIGADKLGLFIQLGVLDDPWPN